MTRMEIQSISRNMVGLYDGGNQRLQAVFPLSPVLLKVIRRAVVEARRHCEGVAFLASDDRRIVSGQTLHVNGWLFCHDREAVQSADIRICDEFS